MRPDFALSLSSEGLSLLQRFGSNWILLDQVYLADADFDGRMEALRTAAMERSRNASQVKLVIPNDQIKYYSLSRPKDARPDDIETMIQLSLQAETPYSLNEISFDWVSNADTIYVAAVARQTLHEAEEFVTHQGFQPLGNVAIAPEGQFIGEVFFGLANGAAPLMECDANPIQVVSSALQALGAASRNAESISEDFEEETDASDKALAVFESVREGAVISSDKPDKSALPDETLIPPFPDRSNGSGQGAAAFFEKAGFFERILQKVLQVSPHLSSKKKSSSRLIRAGHLTAVVFAFVIFALVGWLGFYLTKPENLSTTDDALALDKAPQVQTEARLLSQDHGFDNFAQISNPSRVTQPVVPSMNDPEAGKLSLLRLTDERYSTDHLDLIRPNWGTEPKTASGKEKAGKSEFAVTFQQIMPFQFLQPTEAPAQISKPTTAPSFQFLRERLRRIYAISGVWSFSPNIPFVQAQSHVRNPVVGTWDTLVQRRPIIHLINYEVFEKALLVDQNAPEKKAVIVGLDDPVLKTTKEERLSADMTGSSVLQPANASNQISGVTTTSIGLTSPVTDKVRATSPSFDELLNPNAVISQKLQIDNAELTETLPSKPIAQIDTLNQIGTQTHVNSIELVALTPPDLSIDQLSPQAASLPPARPEGLPPQEETALPLMDVRPSSIPKAAEEDPNAKTLRPKPRPETIKPIEPEIFPGVVAESLRPKARPKIKKPADKTVEIASASAIVPEEEGEEASAWESSAQTTNTTISGKKATIKRALNLREVNLLGVYYFSGKRSALVRLKNGKRLMVKVGDRLDGGKVAAIGKRELRYVKSGENITIDLPG